jgi:hypothetical protein
MESEQKVEPPKVESHDIELPGVEAPVPSINLPDEKVWKFFSYLWYYNKKSLTKSSNIISVWTYKIVTDDERKDMIDIIKKSDLEKSIKYEHLDDYISLEKIDCKNRMKKTEASVDYDDEGHVLDQYTNKNSEWKNIPPESVMETLYNKVCVMPNQPNIDENKYDDLITKAADKFKLDSALIKAIIKAGSNFNSKAVSPVGAQGLMQLKPAMASALKIKDSFNPEQNIEGGARYLRYLLNTYRGNLDLALAAYDAGEKAVAKYNYNIPPDRKTQNYVRRVLSFYKSYTLP